MFNAQFFILDVSSYGGSELSACAQINYAGLPSKRLCTSVRYTEPLARVYLGFLIGLGRVKAMPKGITTASAPIR
jgi:hypothetical protein